MPLTERKTMKRTRLAAVAAAAMCLAAPAAAQADSIVYIKDHNVWIAEPDGSAPAPGDDSTAPPSWAYGSPTQADDGTIVARHGTDIVRLAQNGTLLVQLRPTGLEGLRGPDHRRHAG